MTRNEFLKLQWEKYPAMPKEALCYGRIQKLFDDGQLELLQNMASMHVKVDFSFSPQCFFAVGDLVAQRKDKTWILLAPDLRKDELRKENLLLKTQVQLPKPELLNLWSLYLSKIRQFFKGQNFVELQTPSLVICPGTEPALEAFQTEFTFGSKKQAMYLPTSPELNLKKVLSSGLEKIFEIRSCFRNGEITERHQPEFMMIEWYRAFSNLETIRSDVVQLINFLVHDSELQKQFTSCLEHSELEGPFQAPSSISVHTIFDLFQKQNINLHPQMTLDDYKIILEKQSLNVQGNLTIDDCFFLLMGDLVEPHLEKKDLTFVEQYPPFQAALARINDEGWGERFEVYWQGLEIANAFHELNDPDLQRKQASSDLDKKSAEGKLQVMLDEDFFVALEHGLPPTGGIALGLDRLFMALFQFQNIRTGKAFSYDYGQVLTDH